MSTPNMAALAIQQQPQTQTSVNNQLGSLGVAAARLGLREAARWVRSIQHPDHTPDYFPAINAVHAIPLQPDAEASLDDQFRVLMVAGNRLGLYDAADILRRKLWD